MCKTHLNKHICTYITTCFIDEIDINYLNMQANKRNKSLL